MKNIALIGMPGSGKTTLGKIIAEKLNLAFFDCDLEIEKSFGGKISDIFERHGESYFRTLETQTMHSAAALSNHVISTGGGCVERPENIDILKKSCIIIFINRPIEQIISDADTSNRPLLKNGTDAIKEIYSRRINLYKKYADIEIINSDFPQDAAEKIIIEVRNYENNGN